MSKLLTQLVREHDRILAVISALHDFAALHAGDDPEGRIRLGEFVRFFREYLDGWHHAREEDLLFDVMVRTGFPEDSGPVGCMKRDHELGRGHVQALAQLASGTAPFSPVEVALLGDLVLGHSRVLVPHIAKENRMLYPMAARLLPAELMDALDAAAAALADRRAAPLVELEALADRLVARHAAARVGTPGREA